VEFGLDTFGDVTVDTHSDRLSYAEVIRNVVAQGELADQVGVDAFGLGEHPRDDFAVSAPEIVVAAIAARTERITLGRGASPSRSRCSARTSPTTTGSSRRRPT
jgi:alkanesulfonate monooxygenase SsuD/methylene tetrahydromethanopterin reductase-like flavin-dependent oxidoreductase (luciferase family)